MMEIATDTEVVPVMTEGGVQFMPLARGETPTWLIVFKSGENLSTDDPNGDRVLVGAVSLDEAIGQVLRENPLLRYDDILDHMEV